MTTFRHTFPEPIPADAGVRFLTDAGRNAIVGIEWDVPEEPGPIVIRRRSPEEVRARLLDPSSPLPRELAEALADEVTEGT